MNDPQFRFNLENADDPQFKIPLYDIIMWSKPYFIKRSIHDNPFNTEYFCWIDFGIHRHILRNEMMYQQLFPYGIYEKIRFLFFSKPESSDLDIKYFYKRHIIRLAGTMFSGRKDYLLKLYDYMEDEVKLCLSNRVLACDQCLFTQIFNLYHGSWCGYIITNYYI